jgi:hypothetical protein
VAAVPLRILAALGLLAVWLVDAILPGGPPIFPAEVTQDSPERSPSRDALAKLDAMAMQDVEVLNLTELTKLRDLCHHWHEVVAAEVKRVFASQRK